MKRFVLLSLIIQLGCIVLISAQSVSPIEVRYRIFSDGYSENYNYVARDFLRFTDGFHYSATDSTSFNGSIDEHLLFPPTENTFATETGEITLFPDSGSMVGSIPGSLNVSTFGGSQYSIPIECPTGVNGLEPNIAIAYNSGNRNGIAGWGWNIEGISSIVRTRPTKYYDGLDSCIYWGNTSPLSLDGQRLFVVTESTDSLEYKTEKESFNRIVGYNIQSYGPEYFIVYLKNGTKLKYGNPVNPASYFVLETPTGTNINNGYNEGFNLGWGLTQITDINGNYVDISYNADINNNHAWNFTISEINYGANSNAGTSHFAKLAFEYEDRPDTISSFVSGKQVLGTKRLSSIFVYSNNHELKEYKLHYVQDNLSRLNSIELLHNQQRYLFPKVFTYGKDSLPRSITDISQITIDGSGNERDLEGLFVADRDGNGKFDLFACFNEENSNLQLNSYYASFHSREQNWNEKNIEYPLSRSLSSIQAGLTPLMGDFNGNGSLETIFSFLQGNSLYIRIRDRKDEEQLMDINMLAEGGTIPFMDVGSFYADKSHSDLLILFDDPQSLQGNNGYEYHYKIVTGHTYEDPITGEPSDVVSLVSSDYYIEVPDKIRSIDLVNLYSTYHDDLLINLENDDTYLVKFASPSTMYSGGASYLQDLSIQINPEENDLIKFCDLNLDGNKDIIYRASDNQWYFVINQGNYTFDQPENLPSFGSKTIKTTPNKILIDYNENDQLFFIDINQDGLEDVLFADEKLTSYTAPNNNKTSYYFDRTLWKIFINEGGIYTLTDSLESPAKSNLSCIGDLTGDGNPDWVYKDTLGKIELVDFGYRLNKGLLTTVNDPLEGEMNIAYETMEYCGSYDTYNDSESNINSSGDYILNGFQPILPIGTVFVSNTSMNGDTMQYHYGKLLYDIDRGGITGFRYLGVENKTTGVENWSQNNLYSINNKNLMLPWVKEQYLKNGRKLISRTEVENYAISSLGSNRFSIFPSVTISTDNLNNIEKTNESFYDTHGNLIESVELGDLCYDTTYYHYTQIGQNAWCPNLIDTVVIRKSKLNDDNSLDIYSRTTVFDYNANGNLIKTIEYPGDVNELITEYLDWDDFGHSKTKRIEANNQQRSMTYTFSEDGRYKTSETDQFGKTVTYTWDESQDYVINKTDEFGTTSFYYDSLRQLFKTITPDKSQTVSTLQWAGNNGPEDAIFYKYEEASGDSPFTTWYDTKGRKLQEDFIGLNGNVISTTYQYDAENRISKISNPFFEGESITLAEEHFYDEFGRDSLVITPGGDIKTTYYSSSGSKLVETPSGTTYTGTDQDGFVIESRVNGKSVYYDYYASGLLKSSETEEGLTWTMEYDLQGNRTKLIDPDAGTIITEYDGFGQKLKSIRKGLDGNAELTDSIIYLENGLVEKEYNTNELTTYTYKNTNWVEKVEIPGKHKKEFGYDKWGRVVKSTETIESNETFVQETTYDSFGRVKTETYPSGYQVTNSYDDFGNLVQVKDNNDASIWEAVTANAYGQYINVMHGQNPVYYTYNDLQNVESIKSPGIINYNYTYDSNLNMESRFDSINMQGETFEYDALNRLATWAISNNGTIVQRDTIRYEDPNGGISYKSDIGLDMNYGAVNAPAHAINSISGNPSIIADDEQVISYTNFQKIDTITEGQNNLYLAYGVDRQRRKSIYNQGQADELTRFYMSNYEEDYQGSDIKKVHYLAGGNGLAAIYIEENGNGQLYYAFTDHLGSLTALTNQADSVVERYAFNPWGARRDPFAWNQQDNRESWLTSRGFTLHEHLDEFALINMNGRVYDPILAQFLSPDPQLQEPGNWLNHNRYTYCLNNPLIYTDPDGEWVWLALAIYGAWQVGINAGAVAQANGGDFWRDGFWKGAIVGFATGAIGGSGLAPFGTEVIGTTLWGATVGTASYAGNVWAMGGNNYQDVWKGTLTGAAFGFIASEQFGNWSRGKGFESNQGVFEGFKSGRYDISGFDTWQDAALSYYGFEGKYYPKAPQNLSNDAWFHEKYGIGYAEGSFSSYDDLAASAKKEAIEKMDFIGGSRAKLENPTGRFRIDIQPQEYRSHIQQYKNQGLYPNTTVPPINRIKAVQSFMKSQNTYHGYQLFNMETYGFKERWWHFIYRIPRIF